MKLEFGCGPKVSKGFIGVDVRKFPGVEFVCDAWKITEFVQPNTVDEIYSRHFFEHLTYIQADWTLEAWNTILKPNAVLNIIVPDMLFHIKQWLDPDRKNKISNNGLTDEEWSITGFWGQQRETEQGETWDIHKSGYDYQLLHDKLLAHGFKNIEHVRSKPKNLYVRTLK